MNGSWIKDNNLRHNKAQHLIAYSFFPFARSLLRTLRLSAAGELGRYA